MSALKLRPALYVEIRSREVKLRQWIVKLYVVFNVGGI